MDVAKEFFERIAGKYVLVVGDLMLDRYLWGRVERISPEAPVPIVEIEKEENRLGGAANVALNLKSLGLQPILCGTLGIDGAAQHFQQLMQQQQLLTHGLIAIPNKPTTIKIRIIGNHQQMLRVDKEDKSPLDEQMTAMFLKNTFQLFTSYPVEAIVIEDYNKGVLTLKVIQALLQKAKEKGIPVLVDPKYYHFFDYGGCTLFKPNLSELSRALSQRLSPEGLEEILSAIQQLRKRMPHDISVVTLGEYGMVVYEDGRYEHIPAHYREVVDVSGAGDTVISVLTAALLAQWDAFKAAALANLAGGIVCESVGVVPITKERLEKEMKKIFA